MSYPLMLDDALRAKSFFPINNKALAPLMGEEFKPEVWSRWVEGFRESLCTYIPFEVSNVAEFYYLGCDKNGEDWDIVKDFPGFMPPFVRTWFEWRLPEFCRERGKVFHLASELGVSREACLMSTEPVLEESQEWVRVTTIWVMEGKQDGTFYIGPFGEAFLDRRAGGISKAFPITKRTMVVNDEAMLAMSLIHCRNVEVVEKRNPRQLVRQAERAGKAITQSYRVIEIQPIKRELKQKTGKPGYSKEGALIIRGHFKDYSTGAGLFGQIKGRFWWNQQLHGSIGRDLHYELAKAGGRLSEEWKKGY